MMTATALAKNGCNEVKTQLELPLRLYKGMGPADGKIWVQFFDSDLREVVSRIPGRKFINGDWLIDKPALKRLVLDVYSNPILKQKFFPLYAPEFTEEILAIVNEWETGREIRNSQVVSVPDWLKHNGIAPRPYQLQGALWLRSQRRGLIAFDCGLGKTITVLTALKLRRQQMPKLRVMVICPAGIKSIWRNEIERFTDFTYAVVQGSKEERIAIYAKDVDILILNYDLLILDSLECVLRGIAITGYD